MKIELVAVVADAEFMEGTLLAIRKSVYTVWDFADVKIICPQKVADSVQHEFTTVVAEFDYQDYSRFMLQELRKYVEHDYVMTIQYDSCIIDGSRWNASWLNYDYIGAPWPNKWVNRVGNGGFSLRSRKFLEATAMLPYNKTGIKDLDAEDFYACVSCYNWMCEVGVKFAPVHLAREFCVEHPIPEFPHDYDDLSTYKSFAFHSFYNTAGKRFLNAGLQNG
jgi:hypothetical protein